MGIRVYIETSVVSYYTARPSRDVVVAGHQQATHDFWDRLGRDFDAFISSLVVEEAGDGDTEQAAKRIEAIRHFPMLRCTAAAESLARQIIDGKGVPEQFPEDALHIALATLGGADFLATWNFSHINNPFTRMMIRQVVENGGFVCPEIVSPEELLGEET